MQAVLKLLPQSAQAPFVLCMLVIALLASAACVQAPPVPAAQEVVSEATAVPV